MITFHTIGDSHAGYWEGWGKVIVPGVEIHMHGVPSRLMYSWSNNRETISISPKGNNVCVCFCFGEIDARAHIHKYIPNWQANVDSLINAYISNIKNNTHNKGYMHVFIYNVIPHLVNNPPLAGVPISGTPDDVKKYTLYMNEKLKEHCVANGYHFIDTHDKYCNSDGFLDPSYSDKICHIQNPIHNETYLREFFSKA
jgi:hypothetical protein